MYTAQSIIMIIRMKDTHAMNERYLPITQCISKFTQKTEISETKKERNYCHLHISGMCFPVKVSAFTFVFVCMENTL